MKSLFCIKHSEIFQGEKELNSLTNYFEGWYFKISSAFGSISFIPGINIENGHANAFVQVITPMNSYFINYPISTFHFSHSPFNIRIGNNAFSMNSLHIDIHNSKHGIDINGDISLSNHCNLSPTTFSPYIMGPFSYLSFMECNHSILSMKSTVNGKIYINNNVITFENGIAYIEKDWGSSFPESYVWLQGNNFRNPSASFFLSIANIPFKFMRFRGIICGLLINSKEYKFTTYYGCKLLKYEVNKHATNIIFKNRNYTIHIFAENKNEQKLSAPVNGNMSKKISESLCSNIKIQLFKNDKIIFEDESTNCGMEIVE